jgi:hypothetical protein
MAWFSHHRIVSALLVFLLVIAGVAVYRMWGPYRYYELDFVLSARAASPSAGGLEVGVAKRDITPELDLYDSWTDVDGNGRYEPRRGDTYTDRNGNGRFDAVWLAGFNNNRPAQRVHDPLWVRAVALRNNGVTVVMVTIDSIGIFYEKFIAIRKSIDPALGIDHVMFSSTHNHEAPDTMGIWSYSPLRPLFDHNYMAFLQTMCKDAVEEAVRNLQPADMLCAELELEPEGFVRDSRLPEVYDRKLCTVLFTERGTDHTIATVVSWGNHPETLGGDNTAITSDFPHYWREGVEKGVPPPNGADGLGGMCLYFQGMVGGLMTQLGMEVPHRDGVQVFKEASFDKAQALGENLALKTLEALRSDAAWHNEDPRLAVAAKTIYLPVDGLFKYAIMLGLLHPGYYWGKAKTEINVIRIGDLEILTVPGELYPEIGDGGVEAPEGRDYAIEPQEVPPLRGQMAGRMNMIIGLANDEIGYIIPKSQWDTKPPFAYGREKPQYGEQNSPGPDVAPALHRECLELLDRMHKSFY